MDNYEFIKINEVYSSLKDKYKLEIDPDLVKDQLSRGVVFKGQLITTFVVAYFNKIVNKNLNWYYFICPKCKNKAKKIYAVGGRVTGCRKCSKIKQDFKIGTQADRILKIQSNLVEIFNNSKDTTKKRRNMLITDLVGHFNKLDDKYKFAYNTFLFKELQTWCLNSLRSDRSKEYKEAIRDFLKILRDGKKILIQTGLIKDKF